MDLSLENHVVLVTGGAKGIGAAIVELLASEGAVPVIIGRNSADNDALADRLATQGPRPLTITAELTRTADCQRAVAIAVEAYGQIHGLVNNAGINDGISLEH
ncbi:MAG: SDR family NAD(P)-dependent oxidoreductase, partial [Planctomycetaceae bacterium]